MSTDRELKILSTTALKTVFEELAPRFRRASGNRLVVSLAPSSQLQTRLAGGEAADVAVLATAVAKDLTARGKILAGSLVDIARSSLGVAVPKGAPKPDISTVEAFRRALLAAKSIAVSKPGGGQSGADMAKVFQELGIAEAMHGKAKYGSGGPSELIGLIIERGEAEIGMQQIAELMAVPGVDFVGPLPGELQRVTPFTAGIPTAASNPAAGRALIDFLTTPAAKSVISAKGLDPS